MISIISSAKTLDFSALDPEINSSSFKQTILYQKLLKELKSLDVSEIKTILKVSDKIALENYTRYQFFEDLPQKQAIYAYNGDVYKNIDRNNFSNQDLAFAQQHLCIISGLYGLLKPLDKIKPYRLEMATKIKNISSMLLSKYWQSEITDRINQELSLHDNKYLINVASLEYATAINRIQLHYPMININFVEEKNGALQNIAVKAKKARGMFVNYIISNQIDNIKHLKDFNVASYKYNLAMSDENNYYYVRH